MWLSYTPTYIPSLLISHFDLTFLGHHRALSWTYAIQRYKLAINFTHIRIYMSMLLSMCSTLSFPHCVQKSILYIYVCINRFISTIFLDYICVCVLIWGVFVFFSPSLSFSDLLHSVWQTPGSSTSLQRTQLHNFLSLSNITLYICTTFLSINLLMVI